MEKMITNVQGMLEIGETHSLLVGLQTFKPIVEATVENSQEAKISSTI